MKYKVKTVEESLKELPYMNEYAIRKIEKLQNKEFTIVWNRGGNVAIEDDKGNMSILAFELVEKLVIHDYKKLMKDVDDLKKNIELYAAREKITINDIDENVLDNVIWNLKIVLNHIAGNN